jgi:hypothetical protein
MGEYPTRAGRLFARPSFIEGAARVIDMGCTLTEFNRNKTGEEADQAAILSDWYSIGDDMRSAIRTYTHEQDQEVQNKLVAIA